MNVFNPGLNPFWSTGMAEEATNDDRFHFYLNSGDTLSNGYTSYVNDDSNVHWVKPTHSPFTNHGLSQWYTEI